VNGAAPIPAGVVFRPRIELGKGTISGRLILPGLPGTQKIHGALNQPNATGEGFFLNSSGSGKLEFEAP
jgi:hypothetical protein